MPVLTSDAEKVIMCYYQLQRRSAIENSGMYDYRQNFFFFHREMSESPYLVCRSFDSTRKSLPAQLLLLHFWTPNLFLEKLHMPYN